MTGKAASRIQSAGDRNTSGRTGQTRFGSRAQSAAAGNDTSGTTTARSGRQRSR